MSRLPDTPNWTVGQLISRGLKVDEACWMVYDKAPVPKSLKEKQMTRIGDVHCRWCGDAFEPESYVGEEGAFCSDDCEDTSQAVEYGRQEYDEARYGAASVYSP